MGFFDRLFGSKPKNIVLQDPRKPAKSSPPITQPVREALPAFHDEYMPDTLSLGWYFSETAQQMQMAKIPLKDRGTHMYVIGASGSGKTKFIEFPIQQDIQLGNGFGIIDPHGDLIEETKGFLACQYKKTGDESIFDRVVIIDPTDPKYTVAFNVLELPQGVSATEQAQELIMVFKRIWADSWGARMEDLMRNSLIALAQAGLTLVHLPQFLTLQPFRVQVITNVSNQMTRLYFERFDSLSKANQLTWSDPVTNKVNAFLADERISQMLSQPKSSINLREIMDTRKILLIKLNKGKLQQSADLLGSLLMAKIQMAAFSRTDIPEAARVPFYLYIDEFQNFASESFSVVLSEARKYGLSLIMAHQTLEQIPEELQSVILGNTGLQVYFRINRKDAETLAKEAFTYDGLQVKTVDMSATRMNTRYWTLGEEWEHNFAELQNLPPRCCFVKHKIQGGMLPIQTANIEPAFKVLGMSPEAYPAYLAGLPMGKKYLLDRSSLVVQTPQPQPASNAAQTAPPRQAKPEVPEVKPQPVRPQFQLEELQQAFLDFIIANPDSPMTTVYKGIGVGISKGNQTRDALKELRLIEEIETRLGKGGRPTKFYIPTFTALELLGKQPPNGRGGIIHRHIQHLIEEEATAKGYSAQCEYNIGNGGILDVHLDNGLIKIAVEIAVYSTPKREIGHIKDALEAGYNKVIDVFADERTLERTQEAIQGVFSEEEQGKVKLLHLSKLSHLV